MVWRNDKGKNTTTRYDDVLVVLFFNSHTDRRHAQNAGRLIHREKGDDYARRMNLYISRFSDGVLFSYSTI
jgi:hypothetical protein